VSIERVAPALCDSCCRFSACFLTLCWKEHFQEIPVSNTLQTKRKENRMEAVFIISIILLIPVALIILLVAVISARKRRETMLHAQQSCADNLYGEVLASGNGNSNSALTLWGAIFIVSAVACCVVFVYNAHSLGSQVANARENRFVDQKEVAQAEQRVAIFWGAAIIVPILLLVYGAIYNRSIASTHIQVAENGITGKGAGQYFLWGDLRLFGFRIPYNQVTSVDAAGSTIIVHASGAQYKCYVANPAEIQRVIVEQQQKRT
jgi:H+/gluconate symporter-like permease